jgi:hypothetical protein
LPREFCNILPEKWQQVDKDDGNEYRSRTFLSDVDHKNSIILVMDYDDDYDDHDHQS